MKYCGTWVLVPIILCWIPMLSGSVESEQISPRYRAEDLFRRSDPDADYYTLEPTSLYDVRLRQEASTAAYTAAVDRFVKEFSSNTSVVEFAKVIIHNYRTNALRFHRLEVKDIEASMESGDSLFHYTYDDGRRQEGGYLVISGDGRIRKQLRIWKGESSDSPSGDATPDDSRSGVDDARQEALQLYLERLREAHLLLANDSLSEASEVLEELDRNWPSDALVWRAISELREREGKAVEAVNAARKSLVLAEENKIAGRLYLARLLERLKRFEEAQVLVDEALIEFAASRDSYTRCRLLHEAAHIQLQLGHYKECLSYVDRVLELVPYAANFAESLQSIKRKAMSGLEEETRQPEHRE